ncbi:glycosyltransferase [Streptomyces lunalinharesii]|uniref:Glycosyl transferase family 28 C-terminal domain-containing protein n=1 Tax=Streptomyces lunalinharesii TaxID=333384 RepID=A0ABN3SMA9_9ACTN
MRIVAFAWNHEGLGHVSRLAAITGELTHRIPRSSALFFVEQPYDILEETGITQIPVPVPNSTFAGDIARVHDDDGDLAVTAEALRPFVANVLSRVNPVVALHDSVIWRPLYDVCLSAGIPQTLVLRERVRLADYLASISGELARFAGIVVPHAPSDHLVEALDAHRDRAAFIGPVIRERRPPRRRWWRTERDAGGRRLVVISAGGGGYDDVAAYLSTMVEACSGIEEPLHVVTVTGPLFRGRLDAPPGFPHRLTTLPYEPDLSYLFADADAAVTQAGYNTINELRSLGVPAVLVPSPRGYDDQFQRAAAEAGSAHNRLFVAKPVAEDVGRALRSALALPPRTPSEGGGSPLFEHSDGAAAAAEAILRRCPGLRTQGE